MKTSFAQRSGKYLLANPNHAVGLVFISVLLTLLHLPFIWLAMIVCGLFVLSKGPQVSGPMFGAIMVPIVTAWLYGHGWYELQEAVLALMTCVMASLLYHFRSWSLALEFMVLLSLVFIALVHSIAPDYATHWVQVMLQSLADMPEQERLMIQGSLQSVTPYLAGIKLLGMSFSSAIYMLLSMAWLKRLPVKVPVRDALEVRLSRIYSMLAIGIALGAWGWHWPVLKDAVPVLLLPAFASCLSLFHHLSQGHAHKRLLLLLFYVGIAMMAVIHAGILIGMVVLVSLLDGLFDFRRKMNTHSAT